MQQNRNIFSLDVIFFISVSYNHEYTLNYMENVARNFTKKYPSYLVHKKSEDKIKAFLTDRVKAKVETFVNAEAKNVTVNEVREIADLIAEYEAYLKGRGNSPNTISFYMRILKAVYNRATEDGLTEQRHPFRSVYTGVEKTLKRAISLGDLKCIKGLDLSLKPNLDFARDMFLFCFYTRGMSFIDMAYLR